mgnify:FL=1
MSTEFIVRTLHCEDGVVGLNGYQYLLHEDDSLMKFETKEVAKRFLTQNDIDLDTVEIIDIKTGEILNG